MSLIRPVQELDLPIINAIENEVHIDPWSQGIINDCYYIGYDFYVVEEKNTMAGFAIGMLAVDEYHLLNIAVTPVCQRQGYGEKLLMYFLSLAKQQGATRFLLEVRQSNSIAIALYKKYEFQQIGIRKNYYHSKNTKEDALIFQLDLK